MAKKQTTELINDLIVRMKNEDESAIDELISISQQRLERLARKLIHENYRPDGVNSTLDLLQQANLRLRNRLAQQTPADATGFIRMAAQEMRRELIDFARKYLAKPSREIGDPELAGTDSPEKNMMWREFHERVEALPSQFKNAFDMIFYLGLSQRQAAQASGITLWEFRGIWNKAKEELRRLIGDAL